MLRVVLVLIAIALFSQSDISIPQTFGCTPSDGQTGCKPCLRPGEPGKEKENKWPDVTDLELDKTELHFPPPKEGSPPKYPDHSREMTTSVRTTAADPEGDVLTYNYTISGGRIVGTGANVTWDLNGVAAGTYTITAAVDDGCGLCGAKLTKTITVIENPSDASQCVCPEIQIMTGKQSRSDDLFFSVGITGPKRDGLTHDWTITDGTIVEGQGTSTIKVRRPQETSNKPQTVTVEIGGLDKPDCQCPNTASRTF
jgi:hypothetical protein